LSAGLLITPHTLISFLAKENDPARCAGEKEGCNRAVGEFQGALQNHVIQSGAANGGTGSIFLDGRHRARNATDAAQIKEKQRKRPATRS
jgi:hypothetical protein